MLRGTLGRWEVSSGCLRLKLAVAVYICTLERVLKYIALKFLTI